MFLLRRAGLLAHDAPLEQAVLDERERALQITKVLEGLPLALDQAGAYLEETGCSLSEYQQLYQQHRADLLRERRGLGDDHPPVATTWSLAFQKVEEKNPAAADLLRLCAFLQPDAIPEEIVLEGGEQLGPHIQTLATNPSGVSRSHWNATHLFAAPAVSGRALAVHPPTRSGSVAGCHGWTRASIMARTSDPRT